MPEYRIRAVAFRRGDWWIAQCLEYRLATQTKTLEDLPHELERLLSVQIKSSLDRGVEPFAGFSPAPRRYWQMYERARTRLEAITAPDSQPAEAPSLVRAETRLAA